MQAVSKRILILVVLAAIASAGSDAAAISRGPDDFGYAVQAQAYSWVPITGTVVNFPSSDNSFAGPAPIGFSFPFFENSYTQLFLSTNGTLSFGQVMLTPINQVIPLSAPPNNFIAPLWTDLDVGGINPGKVRYDTLGSAPNRQFVVSWEDVTHVNTPGNPLDFQVILHENGDICFQYQTLTAVPANFTTGIEDFHGVDGVDNSGGVAASTHFCFVHPGATARVKITPEYAGGFVSDSLKDFKITVHNTGGLGTDTYDLNAISSSPGWTIQFVNAGTLLVLPDTDASGSADTGPVPQSGSVDIVVRVTAPPGAMPGDSSQLTIDATSQLNGSVSTETTIQAAVPPSFAQLYQDSQNGYRLQLYSSFSTLITPKIFNGSSSEHSMARANNGNYVSLWEYSYVNSAGKGVTDIKYSVISNVGGILVGASDLTNNNGQPMPVSDENPAAAENDSGQIGVVYVRNRVDDTQGSVEINSNVFLHVVDDFGATVAGPINLTQNTEWRGVNELDIPLFETPRIAAAGNNFVITWIDNRLQAGLQDENDVFLAIRNATGGLVLGPSRVADSQPGGTMYRNPVLTGLSSSRALLAYVVTDSAGGETGIEYAVYNASGGVVKSATDLTGAVGIGLDAVEMGSGNILVAWVATGSMQLNYAVLNSSYNLTGPPAELTTPAGRMAEYVSLAATDSGYGVVTWMDALATQFIYYSLLDGSGDVVTAPMAIRSTTGTNFIVSTSKNGGGNAASQLVFPNYLPLLNRD